MKAPLFLRIAAVITFLYFAGHTAGIPWTPAVGPNELPVLEAMKNQTFEAEGFKRNLLGSSILGSESSSVPSCSWKLWS